MTYSTSRTSQKGRGGYRKDGCTVGLEQGLYVGSMPRQQDVRPPSTAPQTDTSGESLWRAQSMDVRPELLASSSSGQAFQQVRAGPSHVTDDRPSASLGPRDNPDQQNATVHSRQRRTWRNSFAVALCLEPPAMCVPLMCADFVEGTETQVDPVTGQAVRQSGKARQAAVTKAQALRSIGKQLEVTRTFEGAKGHSELPESLFSCSQEQQQHHHQQGGQGPNVERQGQQGQSVEPPPRDIHSAATGVAAEVWMKAFEAGDADIAKVHHSISKAHKASSKTFGLDSSALMPEQGALWAGEEETSESRVLDSSVSVDQETFESTQSSSSRVEDLDRERGVGEDVAATDCNALLMRDLVELKMRRHPHVRPANLGVTHQKAAESGRECLRTQKHAEKQTSRAKLKSLGDAAPFDLSVTGPFPQQAPERSKKARGRTEQKHQAMGSAPSGHGLQDEPELQEQEVKSAAHQREQEQGSKHSQMPGFPEPLCFEGTPRREEPLQGPQTDCTLGQQRYGSSPRHPAAGDPLAECSLPREAETEIGLCTTPEAAALASSTGFSRKSPRRRDTDPSPVRQWHSPGSNQGGGAPDTALPSGPGAHSSPLLDEPRHQSKSKWGWSGGSAGAAASQPLSGARSTQERDVRGQVKASHDSAHKPQSRWDQRPKEDREAGSGTDGEWQVLASALKQAERVALENAQRCRERLKVLEEQEASFKREVQDLTPKAAQPENQEDHHLQGLDQGRLVSAKSLTAAGAGSGADFVRLVRTPSIEEARSRSPLHTSPVPSPGHPPEDVGAELARIRQRVGARMEKQRKGASAGAGSANGPAGPVCADGPSEIPSAPQTPRHCTPEPGTPRSASWRSLFEQGRLGGHTMPEMAASSWQGREGCGEKRGTEARPLLPPVATFEGWGHGSQAGSETPVAEVLERLIEERNSMKAILSPRHSPPILLNPTDRCDSAGRSSGGHTPRHRHQATAQPLFLSGPQSFTSMGCPCSDDEDERSCLLEEATNNSAFWEDVLEDRLLADDLLLPVSAMSSNIGNIERDTPPDALPAQSRTVMEQDDVASLVSSQRSGGRTPRGRRSQAFVEPGTDDGSVDGGLTPRARRVKSELRRRRDAWVRAKLRDLDSPRGSMREDCLAGLVEGEGVRRAHLRRGDSDSSERWSGQRGQGSRSSRGLPQGVREAERVEARGGLEDSETEGDIDT